MSAKRLSIVIPVYNTASYLHRCLKAIDSQANEMVEVVLVDDGSSDGSQDMCDAYKVSRDFVTVVHQRNSGVSAARNAGIEASHGEYLWFCDSDDRVLPGAISKLFATMQANEPVLITFPVVEEDESENQLGLIPAAEGTGYGSNGPLRSGDLLYPYAHVMRRDLVGDERFDTTLSLLEDRDFLYRVCTKVRGDVYVIDQPLYAYFITREDSAVNSLPVDKYVDANIVQWRIFEKELTCGRPEPAYTMAASHTLGVLALIARTGKCTESFEMLRKRLISHDEYSSDLVGSVAAKYALCRRAPGLFKAAYAIEGKLCNKGAKPGSTVLISPERQSGEALRSAQPRTRGEGGDAR